MMKILKSVCLPSLIYFVVSLVNSIINKYNIIEIIINVFLFSFALNYICKIYKQNISWYILFILLIFVALQIKIIDINKFSFYII